MALTYTERTIRGNTQDTILVDGTTDTIVISKNALTSWDIDKLTKAEARIADGAYPGITNMLEALQGYTMPNGATAYDYYTPYLINVEQANASWIPGSQQVWSQVQDNVAAIADHETRITTLEP